MEGKKSSSSNFPCYVIPASHRPCLSPETANVPVIDLDGLQWSSSRRPAVVEEIGNACRRYGFFQCVLDGAFSSAFEFFGLSAEEKVKLMSDDVHKPVKYGSSLKDGVDKIQFWRVFLKHYAHPLDEWINYWPDNPPTYRERVGRYTTELRKLALEITGAITESLGLGPNYIGPKMEEGMQVMAVNCYPPCPEPALALGLPPHSDYSCLTILLQSRPGLQIMDGEDGKWREVREIKGALQVHVGDHMEVLSNGLYKSVMHRATLNGDRTRVSIASLHSFGMDEKMEAAEELVGEEGKKRYKGSSFRDFLKFLAKNDLTEGKNFIDTLKIQV
ncbi:Flavanone 3-dioxygenase [Bertholletia excelsa]